VLTSIISNRDDIKLIHVEADETTVQFMLDYDVRQVPTILLMDNGVVFARAVGFQPEEILELWLDAKIEEHKNSTK
jgi:thioredoxin-like negative regulator of GroEL